MWYKWTEKPSATPFCGSFSSSIIYAQLQLVLARGVDPRKIFTRYSKWPYLSFSAFLVVTLFEMFHREKVSKTAGFTIHIA